MKLIKGTITEQADDYPGGLYINALVFCRLSDFDNFSLEMTAIKVFPLCFRPQPLPG